MFQYLYRQSTLNLFDSKISNQMYLHENNEFVKISISEIQNNKINRRGAFGRR